MAPDSGLVCPLDAIKTFLTAHLTRFTIWVNHFFLLNPGQLLCFFSKDYTSYLFLLFHHAQLLSFAGMNPSLLLTTGIFFIRDRSLYCDIAVFFTIITIFVIRRSTKPFLSLNGYIILSTGLPRIWKRHALRPRLHDPWTRGRQWRNSTLPRGQWWEELQHRVHQPRSQREKQGE